VARGEKSAHVQQAAETLGVSERTVWRWLAAGHLAADAFGLTVDDIAERACESCGEPLPPDATIGRHFCDDTCRMDAYRAMLARHQFPSTRRLKPSRGGG
jgi:hypothetical protein